VSGPRSPTKSPCRHGNLPRARSGVYPDILPVSGNGCWPWVPIARRCPYLRDAEIWLNAMLAAAAARADAEYVDIYDSTIGHDVCQPSGVNWVEELILTSLAVPMHPNAAGEQAMAMLILAALRQPPGVPSLRHSDGLRAARSGISLWPASRAHGNQTTRGCGGCNTTSDNTASFRGTTACTARKLDLVR
jgi:hypothetical protein